MPSTDTTTQTPAWFRHKHDRALAELVLLANRLGANNPVMCWLPGDPGRPALRLSVRRFGTPYDLTIIPDREELFDATVRHFRAALEALFVKGNWTAMVARARG